MIKMDIQGPKQIITIIHPIKYKTNKFNNYLLMQLKGHRKQKSKSLIYWDSPQHHKKADHMNKDSLFKSQSNVRNKRINQGLQLAILTQSKGQGQKKNFKKQLNSEQAFKILSGMNFSHHDNSQCFCNDCSCGRHICKFSPVRSQFHKSSVYKNDFQKKTPIKNKINISTQYDPLKGPNLELKSNYSKEFNIKRNSEVNQAIRHEDSLRQNGPFSYITSYSNNFIGHKGDNQYVKPVQKSTRGYFPFRSKTTYQSEYRGSSVGRRVETKTPDNLKVGKDWYGYSTYSQKFRRPNPEDYPDKIKIQQKPEDKFQYNSSQLKSNYKINYVKMKSSICRAKELLLKKDEKLNKNKQKLRQNTDFKDYSSHFRTLTSIC